MNVQTKSTKGFTIIEVVLVLAIAGLIFLMVFIALPALQRSQRDQARKTDVSTVASAVTSYTSNNRGDFPEDDDLGGYLDDLSDNSPKDKVKVITTRPVSVSMENAESGSDGHIWIYPGMKCGSSTNTGQALERGTTRQFSVVTKLESGNGQYYCQTS